MKIAFVPAARLLSDTAANGEALIAVDLLRRLGARGHQITAWCERADLAAPIPNVDVREVSAAGRTVALGRIAFANTIAREMAMERFDLAHLLFPFNTETGYCVAPRIPLVVGPVNLPWPGKERQSERALARLVRAFTGPMEHRLHARTIARADRILVTGPSSLNAMPAQVRERCVDIPFGVDVSRFPATPFPSKNTIVFFSVLSPRKGAAVAVRAMARVLARVPGARLLIVGADPDGMRSTLEKLADAVGVAHAVSFEGAVAPADVASTYARARVFCQPSFGEPFGMTVIEAMASGRPVVGTLGGGIADAVVQGKGGVLVPQGDHNALADALVEVLADPARAEAMGAFNRMRAEERYALERVVDRIEVTYEAATRLRTNGVSGLEGVAHAG